MPNGHQFHPGEQQSPIAGHVSELVKQRVGTYVFGIDTIEIQRTRARHEDTVRMSMTAVVDNQRPDTLALDLGDHNDGTIEVHRNLGAVRLVDNDPARDALGVTFSYIVLNAGHASWDDLNGKLSDASQELAQEGGEYLDTETGTDNVWTAIAKFVMSVFSGWAFANCDGPVAGHKQRWTGQQLFDLTQNGPYHMSTHHDGTDSPAGCGANSIYVVNWTITRT
jgi:hypothetical protein